VAHGLFTIFQSKPLYFSRLYANPVLTHLNKIFNRANRKSAHRKRNGLEAWTHSTVSVVKKVLILGETSEAAGLFV